MSLEKELMDWFAESDGGSYDHSSIKGTYTGLMVNGDFDFLERYYSKLKNCFFNEQSCEEFEFTGKHFERCILQCRVENLRMTTQGDIGYYPLF